MQKYYVKEKQAVAFFSRKANPDFWDSHWKQYNLRKSIVNYTTDNLFIPLVKKYLPAGSIVLEGGCGWGLLVHALQFQGYHAIGIDSAEKTIKAIRDTVPELDVRSGDVRNLPLKDDELDGYVSAGVIEHFWEGYSLVVSEMARTIKKGGYLFISFPYMSFLRKTKAFLRFYPLSSIDMLANSAETFYQFALNHRKVEQDLVRKGFTVIECVQYDGIKGLKDEISLLKPTLQKIYDGKSCQRLGVYLDKLVQSFASHCILIVLQKNSQIHDF